MELVFSVANVAYYIT